MVEILEFARELLVEEALGVVPVLWILGMFAKETPKVQHWQIPYILLTIGVALTIGLMGFNVDAIIQGVLVSGAAVLGHQLLKQTLERVDDNA